MTSKKSAGDSLVSQDMYFAEATGDSLAVYIFCAQKREKRDFALDD
jgi:hypothetical protein